MKRNILLILGILLLLPFITAQTTVSDLNVTSPYFIGDGSLLTGLLGSQFSNDLSWTNYTKLSEFSNDLGLGNFSTYVQPTHLTNFTNDLGIGNWTLDKSSYYTQTVADSTFLNSNGGSLAGSLIINGNLTIIGDYFTANVTNQNLNGSFTPSLTGNFDIGTDTYKWRNGIFSGVVN